MSEIPINTRVIGEPTGEEILYFEDYVYTFMKRLLEERDQQESKVTFYGTRVYRNGIENYIISGAISGHKEQDKQEYFMSHTFLGKGWIEQGVKNDIAIVFVTQDKKKIKKEDFYIYYAQNEEMQNYMIGWNQEHFGTKKRMEKDDTVRYTRAVQNYNREEVKISFLWKAMNIFGLSFVICVMAYAIVSMNQYYKMKNMEENLEYVIAVMSDSVRFQTESDKKMEQEEVSQMQEIEEQTITDIEQVQQEELSIEEVVLEESSLSNESQERIETIVGEMTTVSEMKEYIVQEGDTLRSIAQAYYGTYDMIEQICMQNDISNPNNIVSGQKLLLP